MRLVMAGRQLVLDPGRPGAGCAGVLQTFRRSRLRSQGVRCRRVILFSAGTRAGLVRGREVANPGTRPQPAHATDAAPVNRLDAATITRVMAPYRCSPPSTSPPAG